MEHAWKTRYHNDNGQDPGDKVLLCGIFTKSNDHKDSQLLYMLPPNTKIVPIVSARAF